MTSYRVEIINMPKKFHIPHAYCTNMLCIPIFLIPGIDLPFRGLELKHDR